MYPDLASDLSEPPTVCQVLISEVQEDVEVVTTGRDQKELRPFVAWIAKADVPEIRPKRTVVQRAGVDFTVKAVRFQDAASWEVYCAR